MTTTSEERVYDALFMLAETFIPPDVDARITAIAVIPLGMRLALEQPEWARTLVEAIEHYSGQGWTDELGHDLQWLVDKYPL